MSFLHPVIQGAFFVVSFQATERAPSLAAAWTKSTQSPEKHFCRPLVSGVGLGMLTIFVGVMFGAHGSFLVRNVLSMISFL